MQPKSTTPFDTKTQQYLGEFLATHRLCLGLKTPDGELCSIGAINYAQAAAAQNLRGEWKTLLSAHHHGLWDDAHDRRPLGYCNVTYTYVLRMNDTQPDHLRESPHWKDSLAHTIDPDAMYPTPETRAKRLAHLIATTRDALARCTPFMTEIGIGDEWATMIDPTSLNHERHADNVIAKAYAATGNTRVYQWDSLFRCALPVTLMATDGTGNADYDGHRCTRAVAASIRWRVDTLLQLDHREDIPSAERRRDTDNALWEQYNPARVLNELAITTESYPAP